MKPQKSGLSAKKAVELEGSDSQYCILGEEEP